MTASVAEVAVTLVPAPETVMVRALVESSPTTKVSTLASVVKLPSPLALMVSVPAAVIVPLNADTWLAAIVTDAPVASVRFSKPAIGAAVMVAPLPITSVSVPAPAFRTPVAVSVPTSMMSSPVLPVTFCPAAPSAKVMPPVPST